jgi:hypothetical protein
MDGGREMKKLLLIAALAVILPAAANAGSTSLHMPKPYLASGAWLPANQRVPGQMVYRRPGPGSSPLTVRANGFVENRHDECRLTAIDPNMTGHGQKGWLAKFICSHDDRTDISLSAWLGSFGAGDLTIEMLDQPEQAAIVAKRASSVMRSMSRRTKGTAAFPPCSNRPAGRCRRPRPQGCGRSDVLGSFAHRPWAAARK